MGAGGPMLGGWLIDHFGWRMVFIVNLPLAIAALAMALKFIPAPAREAAAQRLDLWGSLLATCGLGALTWALTIASGGAGWTRAPLWRVLQAWCCSGGS